MLGTYDSPVGLDRASEERYLPPELMESLGTYDLDLGLERLLKPRRAEVDKIERLWQRD